MLEDRINKLRSWINEMTIPEKNKENILKFDDIGKHNKLSPSTRIYRLKNLRTFSKYVTKEFDKVKDNDIINFLNDWKIYNTLTKEYDKRPSQNLETNMKINLKIFFTWLNKGKIPKCVSWLNIKRRMIELKDEIITPNELKEMIKVCDNDRDRALLSFMYDGGVRCSELLGMKIKDVKPDNYGCLVTVINAKTRNGSITTRTIRVVDSTPYILLWLRVHPFKDKEDSPFWISTKKNFGEPLKHSSILTILRKIKRRSKITKRIFPHLFRHSSATRKAQFLYEHELNQFYGWSNQSKMGYHYCHMTAENVNDKIARIKGGKDKDKEEKKEEIEPVVCPRCQTPNPSDSKFCFNCSYGFDQKETMEMDEVHSFMNWFVKDKDFRELVDQKKKIYEKIKHN